LTGGGGGHPPIGPPVVAASTDRVGGGRARATPQELRLRRIGRTYTGAPSPHRASTGRGRRPRHSLPSGQARHAHAQAVGRFGPGPAHPQGHPSRLPRPPRAVARGGAVRRPAAEPPDSTPLRRWRSRKWPNGSAVPSPTAPPGWRPLRPSTSPAVTPPLPRPSPGSARPAYPPRMRGDGSPRPSRSRPAAHDAPASPPRHARSWCSLSATLTSPSSSSCWRRRLSGSRPPSGTGGSAPAVTASPALLVPIRRRSRAGPSQSAAPGPAPATHPHRWQLQTEPGLRCPHRQARRAGRSADTRVHAGGRAAAPDQLAREAADQVRKQAERQRGPRDGQ
jgi:hypothetical protein